MLTAEILIARANQTAKTNRYAAQGLEFLNSILSDLCETYDFALARGVYQFNFNPALSTMYGSGPYPLPLDYLRTSGSSGARGVSKSAWYLYPTPAFPAGQPIYMVPIDLAEFDQYPQFPSQSTPELWATDMGGPVTQRIILATTAKMTLGSFTAVIADGTGVASGLAMAGEGVTAGTTVTATAGVVETIVGDTHTTAIVDNIADTTGLAAGQYVSGNGVPVGTQILTVDSPTQITLTASTTSSLAATDLAITGIVITMSLAAAGTLTAASVFFGIAPVAYVYPPPLGTYPVTVRYQRKMPPLTDVSQYPWFPNDGYLLEELSARMMWIADDSRANEFHMRAGKELQKYADLVDDKTNRSQQIQLDLRNFGGGTPYDRARNTKYQGW